MKLALAAAIALSIVMAFFAVQNSQPTQVTFVGWYFDSPLVIILLITYCVGAVSAFLTMLPGSLRKAMEISKLKNRLAESSSRVEALEKSGMGNGTADKDGLSK